MTPLPNAKLTKTLFARATAGHRLWSRTLLKRRKRDRADCIRQVADGLLPAGQRNVLIACNAETELKSCRAQVGRWPLQLAISTKSWEDVSRRRLGRLLAARVNEVQWDGHAKVGSGWSVALAGDLSRDHDELLTKDEVLRCKPGSLPISRRSSRG